MPKGTAPLLGINLRPGLHARTVPFSGLELLEICEDYEKLSQELVTEWIHEFMFDFDSDDSKMELIDDAIEFFSNYDNHRTYRRYLTFDKVDELGLAIASAESPLDELLREAHILLNGFFSVTDFVKVYENSENLSWGRKFSFR